MSFKYNKLFDLLKERGITTYKIRKENIISQAALTKMKNGEGNIDTRTLERLCSYLQCQPGDIMEYTEEQRKLGQLDNTKKRDIIKSRLFEVEIVLLHALMVKRNAGKGTPTKQPHNKK